MKIEEFTQEKQEILQSVTEVYKEKIISVVSTSINEDITLDKTAETVVNKNTINESLGNSFVYVHLEFKEGFKGDVNVLLPKSTVSQIADKMLMGEGDAEFDEVEHLDAIQEILNQIMGASSTELTGVFEFPVSFTEAQAKVIDFNDLGSVVLDGDIMTQFNITILDQSDIFFITSSTAFENILAKLSDADSFGGDPTIASDSDQPLVQTTIGSNMIGDVSSGKDLGLLMDVRLPISVELGRKKMFIRDILKLTPGEVVELPKLQGEPVDLFVNQKKFATGEVVVIAENFGIRIKSLIQPEERLKDSEAWQKDK